MRSGTGQIRHWSGTAAPTRNGFGTRHPEHVKSVGGGSSSWRIFSRTFEFFFSFAILAEATIAKRRHCYQRMMHCCGVVWFFLNSVTNFEAFEGHIGVSRLACESDFKDFRWFSSIWADWKKNIWRFVSIFRDFRLYFRTSGAQHGWKQQKAIFYI